jgi:hypothetical protein
MSDSALRWDRAASGIGFRLRAIEIGRSGRMYHEKTAMFIVVCKKAGTAIIKNMNLF